MSDTANTPPQTPVTPTGEAHGTPGHIDVKPIPKIQQKAHKRIEVLQGKVEKLLNDNKQLKQQLAFLKSSHSRIKRIPRATS